MLQTLRPAVASIAVLLTVAMSSPLLTLAQHSSPRATHALPDFGIASLRHVLPGARSNATLPAAVPAAPLASCSSVWLGVTNQNGSWNNALGSIAAASPVDMWAVGFASSNVLPAGGPGRQNFAEHWDGRFWSAVATPQPGADDNVLNDVAAISATDAWAVGFANTGGALSPTALHWNGAAWSAVALPAPALSGSNVLSGVVAFSAADVWAVGQMVANNSTGFAVLRPYIVHWDGTSWTFKDTGATFAGQGDNALYGVGGTSTSDLYAVGYSRATPGSAQQELALHWNGSAWSAAPLANGGVSRTLVSVAALSTSDAMAVGYAPGSNSPTTVSERSTDGGATWTSTGVSTGSAVNFLGSIKPVAPSSYDAAGFSQTTASAPAQPLFAVWSGSAWAFSPGQSRTGDTMFFGLAVPTANDVWSAGTYALPNGLTQNLIETYNGVAAPMNVTAVQGDGSATVSWTPGSCDGGSAFTSYVVFAFDGCSVQSWMTAAASPATFTGLTNGTAYNFRVAPVNGYGMGQWSQATTPVTPAGASPSFVTACSDAQYTLTGNDGAAWQDIDATNLSVSFKPAADSWAVVSGNADLWTANAGYNQDLGVYVSGGAYPAVVGQPEAWKESGGFAGTYSPNAAYVQKAIPVKAGVTYAAKLQWKASLYDPGMIAAGAGPLPQTTNCSCPPSQQTQPYSPTRLTVQLIPVASAVVFNATTAGQYRLAGSDGARWVDMDAANLTVPFTAPAGSWTAYVSGNADLWTQQAGYNQDLGITLTGPGFPTVSGQPEAWKESGGFAGTFSPNAAFVQTAVPVTGGGSYTARLQWKANGPDPGTIWAGAGPVAGRYSPTSITVLLVPAGSGPTAAVTSQPSQTNSDGTYWQPIDPALSLTLAPSGAASYLVTANADLWTTVSGFNQDIGIMVAGGAYGGGFLAAWKESGGLAGTYSPNAAFASTVLHLQPSTTYKVWVVWKTNQISLPASSTIKIGAGPIGSSYSPTRLSAMQL